MDERQVDREIRDKACAADLNGWTGKRLVEKEIRDKTWCR